MREQGRRFRSLAAVGWSTVALAVALVSILLVRTLSLGGDDPGVERLNDVPLQVDAAVERLAGALRFETVSYEDPAQVEAAAFLALHDYLEQSFPRVHARLTRETVSRLSLLYRWPGRDSELDPMVFLAHQDVVPIEAESAAEWSFPPFAGEISAGAIRGRGALDDKAGLVGLLEAVELLLGTGFVPQRTVYLAFGHDEEIGGWEGARRIAELLSARGVRPAVVLDEGGMITRGLIAGVDSPVALIGIAEKGAANIELTVHVAGGHSSMQQKSTAIGILSRAVRSIEDHPLPPRLEAPTRAMLKTIAPRLPFGQRLAVANLWLLEPLLVRILAGGPVGATLRTTVAPTIMRAGVKPNVLPTEARAVINVRLLPGDTAAGVLEHFREVVDDERVEIGLAGRYSDPSSISRIDTPAYDRVVRSIRQAAHEDDLIVAPFLMIGGTDSRHFVGLCDQVYRFLGATITPESLHRVHGIDEQISFEDYGRIVRIYARLLRSVDGL